MVKNDKLIRFLEDNLIVLVIFVLFFPLIANHVLLVSFGYGYPFVHELFIKMFKSFLEREGVLITISAVFIGIFFTVFSILGSIKLESSFATLTQSNFSRLIKFIFFSLLSSFCYLFFSLVVPTIIKIYEPLTDSIAFISLILLTHMLLAALRFGIMIFLIFKHDIEKLYSNLDKEKKAQREHQIIMNKLDIFLSEQEKMRNVSQAQIMQDLLKARKENTER